jgi:hypothetical protein
MELSADRLERLAASAGIERASRAKKTLAKAVLEHLDEALEVEALGMLSVDKLRALARRRRPTTAASRKRDLINVLTSREQGEDELELSELDFLLPDRGRRDLPQGHHLETSVEMLPCRPVGRGQRADVTLGFEVQQLLQRPTLRHAVIVLPSAHSKLLDRLVRDDVDDLIESVVRHVPSGRDERPPLTFVLDGDDHGLEDTTTGRALVALARSLRGIVEIRLTSKDQPLRAQLLAFEEEREQGAFMTAIVGGGVLPVASGGGVQASGVEASVRIAGPVSAAPPGPPCSLVKEWVTHLVRETRSLPKAKLRGLGTDPDVKRKVAYKRDFDTAHELALKHLAEQICRRGRVSCPLFDPTALEPPPPHQHAGPILAAPAFRKGVLLLDDAGLGKTVQAGMILSRELRRRRVLAASDATERRRALVVAPASVHGHWREELTAKFGLEVRIFDAVAVAERRGQAQVLICGPTTLRSSWEDLREADVLVVDEALLFAEETMAALRRLRASVDLCVVISSAPVFDDPSDLLALAELASPHDGFGALGELLGDEVFNAHISEELHRICARSTTSEVSGAEMVTTRTAEDRPYELDAAEVVAYEELRRMRTDYLARGDHEHAGAFAALEKAFLSSPQAFAAGVWRVLEDEMPVDASDLFELRPGDETLSFLRRSGYFKRRLRRVRDRLGARLGPSAPLSAKEAALLAALAECKRVPVVVITQFRATAARVATVLARARITTEVELLDRASSLRERMGVVMRFRERCADRPPADAPAGVLVCTDASAEELGLQKVARVLVHFDLPWNPQAIERRIARLARWGQTEPVRVFNLVAVHPEKAMWTMDSRIAYACRELFGMAEGAAAQALFEVEPQVLEGRLTEDGAPELSLIEDPDPEAIAEVDAWLRDAEPGVTPEQLETAKREDRRLREELSELWLRVSHGQGTLAGARGHLFGRLQQALLQGMVGVLCAPNRTVDDCEDWHLVVGLRILVEAASATADGNAADLPDDEWLVEDEVVHLWAVSPEGELMDWAEFLLGEGLAEVTASEAERIVHQSVLDYLLEEKQSLERRQLDAVPLSAWLESAPPEVKEKLEVVAEHAAAMAEVRHAEIEAVSAEAKDRALVALDARKALVKDDEKALRATEKALARADGEDVIIRHEVLGTQLFVVTH